MITTKSKDVIFTELTLGLAYILYNLSIYNRDNPIPDLVITAIFNGQHAVNSRHYKNEAIDIRSHNFSSLEAKLDFVNQFQAKFIS